jgi:hypothetical protein
VAVKTSRNPGRACVIDTAPAAEGEFEPDAKPVRLAKNAAPRSVIYLAFILILSGPFARAVVPYAVEYSGDSASIPTTTEKEEFCGVEEYFPRGWRYHSVAPLPIPALLAIDAFRKTKRPLAISSNGPFGIWRPHGDSNLDDA